MTTPQTPRRDAELVAQAETRRQRDAYYAGRQACPRCGSAHIQATYVGFIVSDWTRFQDTNQARCQARGCGWNGTAHELIPKGG